MLFQVLLIALLASTASAATQPQTSDSFQPKVNQKLVPKFVRSTSKKQQFDTNGPQDVILLSLNFAQDDSGSYQYGYEQSNGQKVNTFSLTFTVV